MKIIIDDDYWFQQRYQALLYAEHEKDHPQSDPQKCPWCQKQEESR
jgi:hypothetical protein